MPSPDKELRKLFKALESRGAEIRETKKGWMVIPLDETKAIVTIHGTPSDRRAWNNMISELRRSGLLT